MHHSRDEPVRQAAILKVVPQPAQRHHCGQGGQGGGPPLKGGQHRQAAAAGRRARPSKAGSQEGSTGARRALPCSRWLAIDVPVGSLQTNAGCLPTCRAAAVHALLPALQGQQLLQGVAGRLRCAVGSVLCTKGGQYVKRDPRQNSAPSLTSSAEACKAATGAARGRSPDPAGASMGGCGKQHSTRSVSRRSGWLAADRLGASSGSNSLSWSWLRAPPAAAAACSTSAAAATAW